jgi:hypothetical protein
MRLQRSTAKIVAQDILYSLGGANNHGPKMFNATSDEVKNQFNKKIQEEDYLNPLIDIAFEL